MIEWIQVRFFPQCQSSYVVRVRIEDALPASMETVGSREEPLPGDDWGAYSRQIQRRRLTCHGQPPSWVSVPPMIRWGWGNRWCSLLGEEGSHELKADLEVKPSSQSNFELGWEEFNQVSNRKSLAYLERQYVGLSETSTNKPLPASWKQALMQSLCTVTHMWGGRDLLVTAVPRKQQLWSSGLLGREERLVPKATELRVSLKLCWFGREL